MAMRYFPNQMGKVGKSALCQYFTGELIEPILRKKFVGQVSIIAWNYSPFNEDLDRRGAKEITFASSSRSAFNPELLNGETEVVKRYWWRKPEINVKSYVGVTGNFVNINFLKDSEGNVIEKGHSLYALSQSAFNFRKGEQTNLAKTDKSIGDLEKMFEDQGQHFTIGYLTRFGDFYCDITSRPNSLLPLGVRKTIKKGLERKGYQAAREAAKKMGIPNPR